MTDPILKVRALTRREKARFWGLMQGLSGIVFLVEFGAFLTWAIAHSYRESYLSHVLINGSYWNVTTQYQVSTFDPTLITHLAILGLAGMSFLLCGCAYSYHNDLDRLERSFLRKLRNMRT